MKIPKSFKLFGTTINVSFDNNRTSNEGILGDCSYTENKITICDEYKGIKVPASTMLDTFYHEKVHVILDSMGEHELSKNEKFVEVFSRLLRQSEESGEY